MKDRVRYFLVPPDEIGYIGFIVHAYDGLALVRTVDGRMGLIELLLAPDLEEDLSALLEDLAREVDMRELSPEELTALGPGLDLCPV